VCVAAQEGRRSRVDSEIEDLQLHRELVLLVEPARRNACVQGLHVDIRERDEHQPGVEREGVGRFQRGEGVLKNQGWLNVLPARQLLAEVRRISLDEERDVPRDLSRKSRRRRRTNRLFVLGSSSGLLIVSA
jgi:hypothetical protein